jgi:hypothetical protein
MTERWKAADVLEVAEHAREIARKEFDEDGEAHLTAVMLVERDVRSGKAWHAKVVVPLDGMTVQSKGNVAEALRGLAEASDATGIVLIAEAWAIDHDKSMTPAALAAHDAEWLGRYHEHPNRIEIVQIHVEHETFTEMWRAKIARPAGQEPVLGEWERIARTDAETTISGTFSNFLPKRN